MSRRQKQYQATVADNKESVIADGVDGTFVTPIYQLITQFVSTSGDNTLDVFMPAAAEAIVGEVYSFEVLSVGAGLTVTLKDSVVGPSTIWTGNQTMDAAKDFISFTSNGSQWVVVDEQVA